MVKMIFFSILIFFIIASSIIGLRHLSGVERKFLTKILLECMLYGILTTAVIGTVVYLF